MMPVSPKILYDHCYGKYAIAAVNVFTMEQVHGLFAAAQSTSTPVIVQLTPAARNYAHPKMLMAMIGAAAQIYPDAIYSVHLDHGIEEHIEGALTEQYTSVMIDASHDDFLTNVSRTKAVVEKAHSRNIVVEAELGILSGVEDDQSVDDLHARYTDPGQARQFVQLTGCDSLAVAVGTSHGAYKFSGGHGIQFNVLKSIQQQLPGFPLVLHGSSKVDAGDVNEINHYGGRLSAGASGVTDEELKNAIACGICKVNIATDLRLLWTKVHRKFFHEQPDAFDPVVPGREYMRAYKEFMTGRFEALGSLGMSATINLN
ncbi:MAG TPA: class II fructose-bisphosphate aldolase [Chitinophagaceae bacterium]|nr:class II fructose-bisphosphate aldolase [Chitinophagaceae bacterium]